MTSNRLRPQGSNHLFLCEIAADLVREQPGRNPRSSLSRSGHSYTPSGQQRVRDPALFDLALDSKLRGCDLVALKVSNVISGNRVRSRALILQRKTGRPVQFEITEPTRRSIAAWVEENERAADERLCPGRSKKGAHLSTR